MVKEEGDLSDEQCEQAAEVVQLFINIWSKGHGKIGTDELIKAILNDEPMKMRRLAEILNIDIQSIEHMIILRTRSELQDGEQLKNLHELWQEAIQPLVSLYFGVSFTGIYNDTFVIFLGDEKMKHACQAVEESLLEMRAGDIPFMLATAYGLANTAEVRHAFLHYKDFFEIAKILYPHRQILSQQAFSFAKQCHDILSRGEDSIREATHILAPLMQRDDARESLYETLVVYLLDAESNVAATAALLFVHKNTIKYRVHQMSAALHFDVNSMPEHHSLYCAVAIKRLLENQFDTALKATST
jgi:sugar diacid utilization regulator